MPGHRLGGQNFRPSHRYNLLGTDSVVLRILAVRSGSCIWHGAGFGVWPTQHMKRGSRGGQRVPKGQSGHHAQKGEFIYSFTVFL